MFRSQRRAGKAGRQVIPRRVEQTPYLRKIANAGAQAIGCPLFPVCCRLPSGLAEACASTLCTSDSRGIPVKRVDTPNWRQESEFVPLFCKFPQGIGLFDGPGCVVDLLDGDAIRLGNDLPFVAIEKEREDVGPRNGCRERRRG